MKTLTTLLSLLMVSGVALAQNKVINMSDDLDKNKIPASEETRKKVEKPENLSDRIDRNATPAPFEEREQEEEMINSGSGSNSNSGQSQNSDSQNSPQSGRDQSGY